MTLALGWLGCACLAATKFDPTSSGMTVLPSCTVVTPKILHFAPYDGEQTDNTNRLLVTCTKTTPYNVGLDAGTAPGAQVTTRRMTGPQGATLAYALFRDKARTLNWGETPGVDTVSGVGVGEDVEQTLVMYGRIAADQYSALPGHYTDMVTLTIFY